MDKIAEIKPFDRSKDCREVLESALAQVDSMDFVVILGINKSGEQFLRTANGTMHEKTFLSQYWNAWCQRWFMGGMQDG